MKIAKPILIAIALVPLTYASAQAETIATVNGNAISAEMLTVFAGNRLRKDPATLTAEEKSGATEELIQLFVIGTAAEKAGLAKEPDTAAQLELQRMSLLAQTFVQNYVKNNPVSQEQLESAYNELEKEPQFEFKARHILVSSPTQAQDIITKLDNGADFSELAAEHSTGPSANKGGDLGWFSPDQMVKPFSDAVAALGDGQHSATPVQTQFGWHVIQREEQRALPAPEKEVAMRELERQMQQANVSTFLDDLKSKAKIKHKK